MTEKEQIICLGYDLAEERAKRSILAREIEALLQDAFDAVELDARQTAIRRITMARELCKEHML